MVGQTESKSQLSHTGQAFDFPRLKHGDNCKRRRKGVGAASRIKGHRMDTITGCGARHAWGHKKCKLLPPKLPVSQRAGVGLPQGTKSHSSSLCLTPASPVAHTHLPPSLPLMFASLPRVLRGTPVVRQPGPDLPFPEQHTDWTSGPQTAAREPWFAALLTKEFADHSPRSKYRGKKWLGSKNVMKSHHLGKLICWI